MERGLAASDLCLRCNSDREDGLHILRNCNYARRVWEFIVVATDFQAFSMVDASNWFEMQIKQNFRNIISPSSPWYCVFIATIWTLWTARNRLIFENMRLPVATTVNAIKNLVVDMQVALELNTGRAFRPRVVEKWKKPMEDWVKLNTDGSVFNNENSAASGGLLWDHLGNWIFGFSRKLGDHTITTTELLGLREGLTLAWARRVQKIEVEIDSEVVVNLVQSSDTSCHPLGNLIEDCRAFLRLPWAISFNHVRRGCNSSADVLAKLGHGLDRDFDFWLEPPIEVLDCIAVDAA